MLPGVLRFRACLGWKGCPLNPETSLTGRRAGGEEGPQNGCDCHTRAEVMDQRSLSLSNPLRSSTKRS